MSTVLLLTVLSFLFAAVLAMVELGYLLTRDRPLGEYAAPSITAIRGFVQALLGLILAFSISDSASRLEWHRTIVLDEANAIHGAWQLIDLVPASTRPELRALLRTYLDARIAAEEALPRREDYDRHAARARSLQAELWQRTVEATEAEPGSRSTVMPGIRELLATATAQTLAVRTHVTSMTAVFVVVLALLGSLLVGVSPGGGRRLWWHRIAYATVVCLALAVIIDMEYPRTGFVGTKEADQLLIDLREELR